MDKEIEDPLDQAMVHYDDTVSQSIFKKTTCKEKCWSTLNIYLLNHQISIQLSVLVLTAYDLNIKYESGGKLSKNTLFCL